MTFIAIDIMIRKARQRYRHKLMDQRIALAGPSLMSPDPNFIFWTNLKFYPSAAHLRNLMEKFLWSSYHWHTKKPKRLFYLAKCLAMLCYLTDCVETITRLDVNFFFPTGLRLSRVPWVYAKAPWTIEICNFKKKLHRSFYSYQRSHFRRYDDS